MISGQPREFTTERTRRTSTSSRQPPSTAAFVANNHTADFGFRGLVETLKTLRRAGIKSAGAGETAAEAASPAVLESGVQH